MNEIIDELEFRLNIEKGISIRDKSYLKKLKFLKLNLEKLKKEFSYVTIYINNAICIDNLDFCLIRELILKDNYYRDILIDNLNNYRQGIITIENIGLNFLDYTGFNFKILFKNILFGTNNELEIPNSNYYVYNIYKIDKL